MPPQRLSGAGAPLQGEAFARRVAAPLDPVHVSAPDWQLTAADVASLPDVTRCALLGAPPAGGPPGPPRTLLYTRVGKAGSESLKAWLRAHRRRGAFTYTDLGAHEHLTLAGEMEHVQQLQQHARSGWAGAGDEAGGGRSGEGLGGERAYGSHGDAAAAAAAALPAGAAAPRALVVDHVFFLNFSRWGLPVRPSRARAALLAHWTR